MADVQFLAEEAGAMTEIERRKHVEAAIADSRIEGLPPPDHGEQAILDAYIRGEIEAKDLVTAYKKSQRQPPAVSLKVGAAPLAQRQFRLPGGH